MKNKWQSVLRMPSENVSDRQIDLDNTWIRFVEDEDGRGPGVSAFCLEANDNKSLMKKCIGLVSRDDPLAETVLYPLW